MAEKNEPKLQLTDLLHDRNPIAALVFPDDTQVVAGKDEGQYQLIKAYPEAAGGTLPAVWFACYQDSHIALRINGAGVSGVIHGRLTEADRQRVEAAEYETALAELGRLEQGIPVHSMDELREIAGSAARPESIRRAATDEIRRRGASGPVAVQ